MENNKIILRFKLNSHQNIGFEAENLQQDHFDYLQDLHKSGLAINAAHYDDLCKSTINNGHDLLKSNGIFNIDTAVVNPMSTVIGQYLFRLLFGDTDFQNIFHWAKRQSKELEIELEFDSNNKESKELATLPWELMYCPDSKKEDLDEEGSEDDEPDGFFISQICSIYRRYEQMIENEKEEKRELYVSVAFLTKDIENLKEVFDELRGIADEIEHNNSDVHFEFINPVIPNQVNDDKEVGLLTKESLGKIFLGDKNNTSPKVNKVIHLICDISTTVSNNKIENALYFHKRGIETEPIGFKEVFRVLFSKIPKSDAFLKLAVLQAWKDENRYAYSGFEDIAHRIQKDNKTAIISMPYVLNQRQDKDGKATFFETLYKGLADSLFTTQIVHKLRKVLVQEYSYGFPLLYMKGQDLALVSIQKQKKKESPSNTNKEEESLRKQYEHLEIEDLKDLRAELTQNLKDTQMALLRMYDHKQKSSTKKDIDDINKELSAINLEIKEKSQIQNNT